MKHLSLREAGIFLLEIALVAALAISLAAWTWAAATPRAVAASALAERSAPPPRGMLAPRHLFGATRDDTQPAANTLGGLALVGVFSEQRSDGGRAIFARQGGRPASVAVGEAIDGLELREVHPDHVIVLREGAPERIDLERRTAVVAPPIARVPARK